MNFLRSLLHALWMLVTVVPWGLLMLLVSTRVRGVRLYWMAVRWLRDLQPCGFGQCGKAR